MAEVMKSLSESASNMKKITESLCHPLCSCDSCEKLLIRLGIPFAFITSSYSLNVCVCARVHVVRMCLCVIACVCMRVCMRACMRACMRV